MADLRRARTVLKQIMIGGEVVSDITLIRFYVHHCITIAALFCC